jgi:hypothetical protein
VTTKKTEKAKNSEKDPLRPASLTAYFSDHSYRASDLIKAIKAANKESDDGSDEGLESSEKDAFRFSAEDQEAAHKLVMEKDKDGMKLWALLAHAEKRAFKAWVWKAVQKGLADRVGAEFDPNVSDNKALLDVIIAGLSSQLRSAKKESIKNAEGWLRIGVRWLVERREMDAWIILERLRPVFYSPVKIAAFAAKGKVRSGTMGEFKNAIALAGLAESYVSTIKQDRDTAQTRMWALKDDIKKGQNEIERLNNELDLKDEQIAQITTELSGLKKELESLQHHSGHDLSTTKAGHQRLLQMEILPLLENASDALSLNEPDIAHRRIKRAMNTIKENDSDE